MWCCHRRWEEELCELLRDELRSDAFEMQVVSMSMRMVERGQREGAEALFIAFSSFPEEAIVPAAVIDAIASLVVSHFGVNIAPVDLSRQPSVSRTLSLPQVTPDFSSPKLNSPRFSGGTDKLSSSSLRRHVRRWLLQLLRVSLLKGSIEQGVAVHGLVRTMMVGQAARLGGLLVLQREVLRLLLDVYDSCCPTDDAAFAAPMPTSNPERETLSSLQAVVAAAASAAISAQTSSSSAQILAIDGYVNAHLWHHIAQAQQPETPLHTDMLIMRTLNHSHRAIQKQVVPLVHAFPAVSVAQHCIASNEVLHHLC